jgi:heat shock protein HslJ
MIHERRRLFAIGVLMPAVVAACAHAPLSPSAVVGDTWRLVSLQRAGAAAIAVDNPERYTVMFGDDGRLSVKSDCNSCRSSYALSGSALMVQALACTKAYCGTASLDTPFTSALSQAQTVSRNGEVMTIQGEGAIARFRR